MGAAAVTKVVLEGRVVAVALPPPGLKVVMGFRPVAVAWLVVKTVPVVVALGLVVVLEPGLEIPVSRTVKFAQVIRVTFLK